MLAAVRFHAALNWWIFCSFVIRRHELLFFPFFWISLKMLLSLLSRNSCFMADTWNILKAKWVLLKFIWVMLVYWRKHNDRLPLTHHMYICEPFFCLCELGHVPIFRNYSPFLISFKILRWQVQDDDKIILHDVSFKLSKKRWKDE